MYTIRKFN